MTVVLAGGTGGLGSATAKLLAKNGFDLVLSYRSNQVRADDFNSLGRVVQADLADPAQRDALLDAAAELYGLVIFTGTPARMTDFEAACRLSFEVNFLGPVMLARAAAERMRSAGKPGAIVLISTMQAVSVFPGSTAYASQKAALVHAGLILAKEYSELRVNVVCPGVTQAGMAEASIASGKYAPYLESGAIPRYGRAEDVARAVQFLLTPDSYVTGQVLTVDGGLTL